MISDGELREVVLGLTGEQLAEAIGQKNCPCEFIWTISDEERFKLALVADEVAAIDHLISVVDQTERRARAGTMQDADVARQILRERMRTTEMMQELRHRGYGKVIVLENCALPEQVRAYRISQVNWGTRDSYRTGLREGQLNLVQRGAPLAGKLISLEVDQEVTLPDGTDWRVIAVVYPERHEGASLRENYRNFRRLELHYDGTPVQDIWDARASLERAQQNLIDFARESSRMSGANDAQDRVTGRSVLTEQEEQTEAVMPPPSRDEQLGAHFYTRTTAMQESLLRRSPYGLVVVQGIAGSGKTSVALGRTKFLCDQIPEEDAGAERDFTAETSVGFVLSEQLSAYLKSASRQLNLNMPIREYRHLRKEALANRRIDSDLQQAGKKGLGEAGAGIEGTMAWLRAAERGVAQVVADELVAAFAAPPGERETRTRAPRTEAQKAELDLLWDDLRESVASVAGNLREVLRSPLKGLAERLDKSRERFATALESSPAWTGPSRKEMRQSLRSGARERVVRALRIPSAYLRAVASEGFQSLLAEECGSAFDTETSSALRALRARLREGIADTDLDVIIALYEIVSAGYRGREGRDPISHLVETGGYSHVFIDEYQDFTEVQLFVMGQQSSERTRSVTVVGDVAQRLRTGSPPSLDACFPWASKDDLNPEMLLENKRQTGHLAQMTHDVRREILGDQLPGITPRSSAEGERVRFRFVPSADFMKTLVEEIQDVPQAYSVAVLCPSEGAAEALEQSVREDLTASFRESRVSRQADLLQRHCVHFSTPLQAKGIEFDAVIVADAADYRIDEPTDANGFYVACSRARRMLTIVGSDEQVDARIKALAGTH